jgi:membrane-associated phospholipid phosphatase
MPSFHAGWNLMLGIALFRATTSLAVRAFAVLMPAAMAFATVATANHFVVDVLAGVLIILASFAVVNRLERERPRAVDDTRSLRGRDQASRSRVLRRRTRRGERSARPLEKRHTRT